MSEFIEVVFYDTKNETAAAAMAKFLTANRAIVARVEYRDNPVILVFREQPAPVVVKSAVKAPAKKPETKKTPPKNAAATKKAEPVEEVEVVDDEEEEDVEIPVPPVATAPVRNVRPAGKAH